jgi:hypothetical protein
MLGHVDMLGRLLLPALVVGPLVSWVRETARFEAWTRAPGGRALYLAAASWVALAVVVGVSAGFMSAAAQPVYRQMGLELPLTTQLCLDLVDLLRTGPGLICSLSFLFVSLLPVLVGRRTQALAAAYFAAALTALALLVTFQIALHLPGIQISWPLQEEGPAIHSSLPFPFIWWRPGGVLPVLAFEAALAVCLVSVLCLLGGWALLARHLLWEARSDSDGVEWGRMVVIGALPASAAAGLGLLVSGGPLGGLSQRLPYPTVSPALFFAATFGGLTFLAMVGVRSRALESAASVEDTDHDPRA